MTAHHADDQLETLLFRLARSGSVTGMTGIAPMRRWGDLLVVRPLLTVPKAALVAYAAEAKLAYCQDDSNLDVHYARNRLRRDAVPAMKAVNAGVLQHAGRFSRDLEATMLLAQRQVNEMLPPNAAAPLDWHRYADEPEAIQQLLLTSALTRWHVQVKPPVQAALLGALAAGRGTKQFDVAGGRKVVAAYGQLSVRGADAHPGAVTLKDLNRWYSVGRCQFGVFTHLPAGARKLAAVPVAPVLLRTRRPHDEVQLANGQHQLLRRFFLSIKKFRNRRAVSDWSPRPVIRSSGSKELRHVNCLLVLKLIYCKQYWQ